MKILIVDDDNARAKKIQQLIDSNIGSSSCEVTLADCYDEAKNLIRKEYFDVLVLDVILPKRVHETPEVKIGYQLLDEIIRRNGFHRPERIIGITANNDDIESYREKFLGYCFSVIEANPNNFGWEEALVDAIYYSIESGKNRKQQPESIVITVHGIRTYGKWQDRLRKIVCNQYGNLEFHTYRYGYFAIPSFFLPMVRDWEVSKFTNRLRQIIEKKPGKRIKIFSHSFGTYIAVRSIESLAQSGFHVPLDLMVLSGSVLKRNYDWNPVLNLTKTKIVNECGTSDYVLWLSEAFVPLTGMAGRVGFTGFSNSHFINRYHTGGHSLYFDGDEFMSKNWLPLLNPNNDIEELDCRKSEPSIIIDGILQNLVISIGKIKWIIYTSVILGLITYLLTFLGVTIHMP